MADGHSTLTRPPINAAPSSYGAERAATLRAQMEQAATIDIKEEGKELREAADESLNVILDLALDGTIRWVSPTWPDVVGTETEDVRDRPIRDILVENESAFADGVDALRRNDASSKIIRFSVHTGPKSRFAGNDDASDMSEQDVADPNVVEQPRALDLEAQGIMVYDRATGEESHVSVRIHAHRYRRLTIRRLCG